MDRPVRPSKNGKYNLDFFDPDNDDPNDSNL